MMVMDIEGRRGMWSRCGNSLDIDLASFCISGHSKEASEACQ